MQPVRRLGFEVRATAVWTLYGLAHVMNVAQVEHKMELVFDDLAAILTHKL